MNKNFIPERRETRLIYLTDQSVTKDGVYFANYNSKHEAAKSLIWQNIDEIKNDPFSYEKIMKRLERESPKSAAYLKTIIDPLLAESNYRNDEFDYDIISGESNRKEDEEMEERLAENRSVGAFSGSSKTYKSLIKIPEIQWGILDKELEKVFEKSKGTFFKTKYKIVKHSDLNIKYPWMGELIDGVHWLVKADRKNYDNLRKMWFYEDQKTHTEKGLKEDFCEKYNQESNKVILDFSPDSLRGVPFGAKRPEIRIARDVKNEPKKYMGPFDIPAELRDTIFINYILDRNFANERGVVEK